MSILIGLLLGLISSFLGVGGGVFLVPLLPYIYDIEAFQAIILSLSFILVSVCINTVMFSFSRRVVWSLTFRMAPFIVMGGYLGATVASRIPPLYLRVFLAFMLLFMSYSFYKVLHDVKVKSDRRFLKKLKSLVRFDVIKNSDGAAGFFAGCLSGLVGIGTGVMLNLVILNNPGVNPKKVSPTVNSMMVFVCLGAIVSVLLQDYRGYVALFNCVGFYSFLIIVLGIIVGSQIGKRLNEMNLHKLRVRLLLAITFTLSVSVFIEVLWT